MRRPPYCAFCIWEQSKHPVTDKSFLTAEIASAEIIEHDGALRLGFALNERETRQAGELPLARSYYPALRIGAAELLKEFPAPAKELASPNTPLDNGKSLAPAPPTTPDRAATRKLRAPSEKQRIIENWLKATDSKAWPDLSDREIADQIDTWYARQESVSKSHVSNMDEKTVARWRQGPRFSIFFQK